MTAAQVTRFCVHTLGVTIPLDVRGATLAEAIERAWRDCLSTQPPDVPPLSVVVGFNDAPNYVSGADLREVLHRLSPAVTQRAISARAGDLVMLHAAALADPMTGATAVLVAASGTGKTTASRTLGVRLAYLSDETAGVTAEGRMVPYRKPLSLLEEGTPLKTQRAASSLGLTLTDRDCHLAAVLVIERQSGHFSEPVVTPLATVDALTMLVSQCSFLPSMPSPLHRLADLIHQTGGAHHVVYGEAETLEPLLARLLGRES